MSDSSFRAIYLEEAEGEVSATLKTDLSVDALPPGEVLVAISHSTLNYKDDMILNGIGRLVRRYPHVPGVDFAGVVEQSSDERYKPGDKVVLTGWRVGETHWGGLAEKARVQADWLVPLPDGLSARQCMALGTAGFTAMLAVMALEEHGLSPDMEGEVLVTGAAGGVGSVATAVLAGLGYTVAASTGRAETHDYLRRLGAKVLIDRGEIGEAPKRPLGSERWLGCVDAVGGDTLANVLSAMKTGGSVASVGLAGGNLLTTTVLPFLLRGVNLLGIDSVTCPYERRVTAWARLAKDLDKDLLESMIEEISLPQVLEMKGKFLKGEVKGRVVVDMAK